MAKDFDPNIGAKTQFQSGEQAARNGSKGGKASVIAKKKRKLAKEYAADILYTVITSKNGNTATLVDAALHNIANAAMSGSIKHLDFLLRLAGQAPTNEVQLTGKGGKDLFEGVSEQELLDRISELNAKIAKCQTEEN